MPVKLHRSSFWNRELRSVFPSCSTSRPPEALFVELQRFVRPRGNSTGAAQKSSSKDNCFRSLKNTTATKRKTTENSLLAPQNHARNLAAFQNVNVFRLFWLRQLFFLPSTTTALTCRPRVLYFVSRLTKLQNLRRLQTMGYVCSFLSHTSFCFILTAWTLRRQCGVYSSEFCCGQAVCSGSLERWLEKLCER